MKLWGQMLKTKQKNVKDDKLATCKSLLHLLPDCGDGALCHCVCVEVRDNCAEPVLWDWTHAVGLSSKHPYPLSHPASSSPNFSFSRSQLLFLYCWQEWKCTSKEFKPFLFFYSFVPLKVCFKKITFKDMCDVYVRMGMFMCVFILCIHLVQDVHRSDSIGSIIDKFLYVSVLH